MNLPSRLALDRSVRRESMLVGFEIRKVHRQGSAVVDSLRRMREAMCHERFPFCATIVDRQSE
jgi:hypothetical protein